MFQLKTVTITHKHGTNVFYGITEDEVTRKLAEYCHENWELEELTRKIPENDDDLISEYFDQMSNHESYVMDLFEMPEIQDIENALIAIKARINGEFDNPYLQKYGNLHANKDMDILRICGHALSVIKGE